MTVGTAAIIGLTIAGAAVSAKQAQEQNKAISRSATSAERGQRIQNEQIRKAAVLERRKIESQATRVRGLIRISGAARGVGITGSIESQLLQADLAEQLGFDAIHTNQASALESARSRLEAIAGDLGSRELNPILSAFSGGIQGLQTGLAIVSVAQQIGQVGEAANAANTTTIPKTPKRYEALAREFRVLT